MSACSPTAFAAVFLGEMNQGVAESSEAVEYTHKAKISSVGARRTVLEVFKVTFGTTLFIRESKTTVGVGIHWCRGVECLQCV